MFALLIAAAVSALYGIGTFMLAKNFGEMLKGVLAVVIAIVLAAVAFEIAIRCHNPN